MSDEPESEELAKTNVTLVDKWTPIHFISGMIAGYLRVPLPMFVASFVAFELIERGLEHKGFPALGTKKPETLLNTSGDLAAACLGYAVMAASRKSPKP